MQAMIDHVAAVVIGPRLLLPSSRPCAAGARTAPLQAAQVDMGKTELRLLVDTLEQDVNNMGSGMANPNNTARRSEPRSSSRSTRAAATRRSRSRPSSADTARRPQAHHLPLEKDRHRHASPTAPPSTPAFEVWRGLRPAATSGPLTTCRASRSCKEDLDARSQPASPTTSRSSATSTSRLGLVTPAGPGGPPRADAVGQAVPAHQPRRREPPPPHLGLSPRRPPLSSNPLIPWDSKPPARHRRLPACGVLVYNAATPR